MSVEEVATCGHSTALDLSQLPSKVAEVQSELQRLEQAVEQTRDQVKIVLATQTSACDSAQLLEQQRKQDVADIHTMQLQLADLQALKACQDQIAPLPKQQLAVKVCFVITECVWAV